VVNRPADDESLAGVAHVGFYDSPLHRRQNEAAGCDSSENLLAASSADRAVDVTEGSAIMASVKLTRRTDTAVCVSFVSSGPLELGVGGDSLGVGGSAEGIASPTLVFTSSNWNVAQTFPIRSIQDNVADGTRTLPVREKLGTGADFPARQSRAKNRPHWPGMAVRP